MVAALTRIFGIHNLALAVANDSNYQLNANAFTLDITSANPEQIDRMLRQISTKYDKWKDLIGKDTDLSAHLGETGAGATANEASARLHTICRKRNSIAHGGDGEPIVDKEEILEAIAFLEVLATCIQKGTIKLIDELTDED